MNDFNLLIALLGGTTLLLELTSKKSEGSCLPLTRLYGRFSKDRDG